MELIIIFTVLALIGVATVWTAHRAAIDTETTIRLAIDRGILTDAALIPVLREPPGLKWVERLMMLGIIVLFASGGIIAMALVLIVSGTGTPLPLFVLAAFSACLGAGLIYCSRWLRRTRERQ